MKDTHTLWLTGCLLLTNCKTLENVYTVTSLGQAHIQVQSSHALMFYGITLERSVAFRKPYVNCELSR